MLSSLSCILFNTPVNNGSLFLFHFFSSPHAASGSGWPAVHVGDPGHSRNSKSVWPPCFHTSASRSWQHTVTTLVEKKKKISQLCTQFWIDKNHFLSKPDVQKLIKKKEKKNLTQDRPNQIRPDPSLT